MRLAPSAVVTVAALAGVAGGLGLYTFVYAKGYSYLTNDPEACPNCHVMNDQYAGWVKSSHRAVATCNDCHTPAGFVRKYAAKARNGFWHSVAFTSGRYPEPLRIKPHNTRIAEEACRRCHQPIVDAIEGNAGLEELSCIRCHGAVGHPR